MNEVLSAMIWVGGFIMAVVWIVFPFTVASLLKEIIAQLKLVQYELRKFNQSGSPPSRPVPNEQEEFRRPSKRELEEFLGPGPR